MSNLWFIGDLHWGHKSVTKWRPFSTEEEHRNTLLTNLLSVVRKRDTLWILGDSVFSWAPEVKDTFMELRGTCDNIRLTIGNHCGEHMSPTDRREFLGLFDDIYGLHKKYGCWLSHGPIHPAELRGKWCVHGHVHQNTVQVDIPVYSMDHWVQDNTIDDPRYFNMSVENHNYFPRDLKWLRGEMEERRVTLGKYDLTLDNGGHQ